MMSKLVLIETEAKQTMRVTFPLWLMTFMLLVGARPVTGQVTYLAELSTTDVDQLNRDSTVVILPLGVLEEHGPHLPVFTDGFTAQWLTKELAEEIVTRRGWSALVFPTIPLGVGEPEEFAPRARFPGSYAIRPSTQRAILMDIATGLGETGFKWVFVVHAHGPLVQSRTIDEAGEYFEDLYGGTMVNLIGVTHPIPNEPTIPITTAERAEDGRSVHAGMVETSRALFVRPDLVKPAYSELKEYYSAPIHRYYQEDGETIFIRNRLRL